MPALATESAWSRTMLFLGIAIVALLAASMTLWAYYGTAVFFEMLRAGWQACF